ncbi:T6SS immunity protein Tdi1 domain-containing protein [Planctomycetaceae bacterium SH139]
MNASRRVVVFEVVDRSRRPRDRYRYLARAEFPFPSEVSMPITMNDLTISVKGVDMETLLSEWTWAMPEPLRPVLLTVMGDTFAQGESGAVYFVDMVEGTIRCVADNGESFRSLLRDNQFVTDHMFPSRIVQFRNAGMTLQPKQVYSHKQLLVLGGADDIGNVDATDVSVHISVHGQVHRQVEDLPDGAPISEIKIN